MLLGEAAAPTDCDAVLLGEVPAGSAAVEEAETLPVRVGVVEAEPLLLPVAVEVEVVEGMGWPVPV